MDGVRIGTGWTILFTATPAWARAQSEHEWSVLSELFGWKCATAIKLVRKTSRTQSHTLPRYAMAGRRDSEPWRSRRAVPLRRMNLDFMSSEMLAELR